MAEHRPHAIQQRRVDPDPSITSAIGRHHRLETAIADLVDNSIDAQARNVLVRVLQRDDRAVGLLVVDDGVGMDSAAIDSAMTYARQRDYDSSDLGHFGIGLKAASLSQAETLWVWSRRHGVPAVGRGLERSTLDSGPVVQTFSAEDASERLSAVEPGFDLTTGTVVEWRDLRGLLQSPDLEEQNQWLESALESVRTHLGLVLHRILARDEMTIVLDVIDEEYPEFGGPVRTVEALDPFGYPAPGASGYPRDLALSLPGGAASATLHLWPTTASSDPNWLLGGRDALASQGLYVYRNDRLLQAGGWNSLTTAHRDRAHARVELDLSPVLEPYVTINPEKTGVVLATTLAEAWSAGVTPEGTTFADYLEIARDGATRARTRNRRPVEAAEPGRGFSGPVADAIEDNATYPPDTDPIDIRWTRLMDDEVFRVDREQRTIWLNSRYRGALGGTAGLSNNDAQVTKLLIHLLLGKHAASATDGAKRKLKEAAWQAMLLAAVHDVEMRHRRPPGRHAALTTEEDE